MTMKESVISNLRQSALSIVELTRPSRYIRFLLRMSETYRQTNNCQHCFRAHRMHRINVVICHTCFTLRGLCVRVLGTPVSPAKRMNRSRCHSRIDSRLVWTYGNCNRWECTLALSGEYDWTTRVRRRCGLVSSYSEHLLVNILTKKRCNRISERRRVGRFLSTVIRVNNIEFTYRVLLSQ